MKPTDHTSDETIFSDLGTSLADAVAAAMPTWVEGTVRRFVSQPWPADLANAVETEGREAASSTGQALGDLLALDVDEQWTNPLTLIRGAVRYPNRILADFGIAEPWRDEHATRFNPDDIYDIAPAAFADLGPEVGDLGLRWGAAKAHIHLRRRREEQVA